MMTRVWPISHVRLLIIFRASVLMSAMLLFSSHLALAQFTQQGSKLVGSDAIGLADQGHSVALSADGNTAIVGGYLDNNGAGAAWVYTRIGGVWTQQGSKLVGTGAVGDTEQGISVALSADGNTAVVGGYFDDSATGAAWVYTRRDGVWTQLGSKLVGSGAVGSADQGWSVALSADGNTAIVGGPGDNSRTGAAWVYTRRGNVWIQQGSKLVGSGVVGPFADQGISVALSADGNTAVVGGYFDDSATGAAWVYTRRGGVWTQQGSKLVGGGAVGGAEQGWSVALSGDGNTAIVGGPGDNFDGAAWVYTRSGGVWTQQGSKLVGTGAVGGAEQGWSVALSADGDAALVGGYFDSSGAGAAWVYTRSGGVWTQQGSKLVGSGAVGNAQQGTSVALSADANTAIMGGPFDNPAGQFVGVGAAWVFASGKSRLRPT
jgi:antibiotic biosynthesis monooxygenase (ABM) superfamily enzyme